MTSNWEPDGISLYADAHETGIVIDGEIAWEDVEAFCKWLKEQHAKA